MRPRLGSLLGAAVLLPIGFVAFLAAWGISLNRSPQFAARVACGLAVSAASLGGFAACAFYANAEEPPPHRQGGC